jgi:hypothetical protein
LEDDFKAEHGSPFWTPDLRDMESPENVLGEQYWLMSGGEGVM